MKKLLCSILLLLVYSTTSIQAQTSLPFTPSWISDGSSTAGFLPQTFYHQLTFDNHGTPALDPAPSGIVRRTVDPAYDVVSDGSNGFVVVYEATNALVEENASAGTATYVKGGSHIYFKHVPQTGSTVTVQIDDGSAPVSLPKVIKAGSNYYVCYKSGATGSQEVRISYVNVSGVFQWTSTHTQSVSGGTTYDEITEYSMCKDNSNTAYVTYANRVTSTGNVALHLQGFATGGSAAFTLITVTNSSTKKWNPIIDYNDLRSQLEIFWGEHFAVAPDYIYVQAYNLSGTALYVANGQSVNDAPVMSWTEFYATPTFNSSAADSQLTTVAFQDPTALLTANAYLINGSGSPGRFAQFTQSNSFPAGLAVVSGGGLHTDNPIIGFVDITASNAGVCKLNLVTNTSTTAVNTTTITSSAYKSVLGVNSNGIFMATPDDSRIVFSQFSTTPSYSSGLNRTVRTDPNTAPYLGGCIGSSTFTALPLEHGNPIISTSGFYTIQKPDVEAEYPREKNATFNFLSYLTATTTSTPPFSSLSGLLLVYARPQRAPHIAVNGNLTATVFEHLNDNGTSDIYMAHKDPATGAQYPAVAITNGVSNNASYFMPKVAVAYDAFSNTNVAFVTYMKNDLSTGGSQMCQQIVSIDVPGGGPGTDVPMDGLSGSTSQRINYDIIYDPVNFEFISIYMNKSAGDVIHAAGFTTFGANNWNTDVDSTLNPGDPKKEVRACYNPDPGSEGVYVVWAQTSNISGSPHDLIFLNEVLAAGGGIWTPGLKQHGTTAANGRYEPVVAASANWVMLVWADEQDPTATSPTPRIYGCAYTNAGVMQTGWAANGSPLNDVSAVTTPPTGPFSVGTYSAFEPDIAATVTTGSTSSQGCTIAFSEEDAGNWTSGLISSTKRIGTRFIPVILPGTLTTAQKNLSMSAGGTTLQNTMMGVAQRKPKLTLISYPSGSTPLSGDFLLCTYETQPYAWSTDTRALEANAYSNGMPFADMNIVSRVLSMAGDQAYIDVCVARGGNAHELGNVVFSSNYGPMAAFTDYNASNDQSGDIRTEELNWDIRKYTDFATGSVSWNIPIPHAIPASTTKGVTLYNNSLWPYPVFGTAIVPVVGTSTWTILSSPTTLNANTQTLISVRYTVNASPVTDQMKFQINTKPYSSGPTRMYEITNGNGSGKYATGRPTASDNKPLSISAYPNPSVGVSAITIDGVKDRSVQMELINMLGQVVRTVLPFNLATEHQTLDFDMSSLPTGNYMLRATQDDGSQATLMLTFMR